MAIARHNDVTRRWRGQLGQFILRANPHTVAFTILWLLAANLSFGGTVNQVGTYTNWATTWQTLPSGIEANNGLSNPSFEFVGDLTNPGLYWANNNEYIFFRMRVDADTFTTASGAHILLIDIVGQGNTGIDYGFAWDSKSNDNTKHGLEMQIPGVNGPTWGASGMNDIDGMPSIKAVNDINGLSRTTDGYVRSVDGQSTTNFGNTTFIDFAVKWSYLLTYTNLTQNQEWKIAVASIDNATDHNVFDADIGGGANLADNMTTTGWSGLISVPEPSSTLMIALAGFLGVFRRRTSLANTSRVK